MCAIIALAIGMLIAPVSGVETPGTEVWSSHFELAKNRAVHSGKDLLVCFTLDKWNPASRKMSEQVLSNATFQESLSESFELVWVDLSDAQEAQEQGGELKEQFEIASFPSVVLASSQGVPYAITGFVPGGVESYVEHLQTLYQENQERELLVQSAAAYSNLERVKILASAIPQLGGTLSARFYGDMMRDVIEGDPQNLTGVAGDFRRQLAEFEFSREITRLERAQKWDEIVQLTEEYLAANDLQEAQIQSALMCRYEVQSQQGDWEGMVQSLAQVVEIDPASPDGLRANDILQEYAEKLRNSLPLQSSL